MSTRDIRTSHAHTVCDVCGRTLLRGENAETYINGGTRRSVCELCKTRALHEGWVREGTIPDYDDHDSGSDRRRSLLGKLRNRRDGSSRPSLDDELSGGIHLHPPVSGAGAGSGSSSRQRSADPPREPRHVRAVPVGDEHKVLSAVDLFNRSEHPRTVAGVARSLGAPVVSIAPGTERPSLVNIVVSWELCWYRYEVDLSDEVLRVDGQGYELSELADQERLPNATADDVGHLYVA